MQQEQPRPQVTGAEPVDDPTDLTREDYLAATKRTVQQIKQDDVAGLAAGVAFRMFLSLFPSAIAAIAIFSLVTTHEEITAFINQVQAPLPEEALELLREQLTELVSGNQGTQGLAAVVGIAAGLFAATSAAVSLMRALSRAYDVAEKRKLVAARLIGLALSLALLVALAVLVVLLVAGPQLQHALLPGLPEPLDFLFGVARGLLAFGVLILLFAFVYWVGPNRDRPSWQWISPGALLGVVAWLLVSGGFTLYVQTAGNYAATYGALAGVVVLLLWLQLSMLAILVGAEFNAEVERARAMRLALREGAGFAAPAPSGAFAGGAAESGTPSLARARVAASASEPVDPRQAAVEAAPMSGQAGSPTPPATPPPQERPSPGRLAGLAAGVTAAAVFLGLATRRRRAPRSG